jgi:hypothetical protein
MIRFKQKTNEPSLQTLLITPMIGTRPNQKFSLPSSLPLLQRLEVLPPLLEPVEVKGAGELFRLRVCHLPNLSHLSLYHGCNFDIDDDNAEHKWHSPLLQSLQFGAMIFSEDLETIMSSSLYSLLRTLHVYCVGVAELEMIAKQCPNLQHFSIYEIAYDALDVFGLAIGKMTQLKSLSIDLGDTPNRGGYLSSKSWLDMKSLIHLQRLTIKGYKKLKSLKSFPRPIELVQYLSNNQMNSSDQNTDPAKVSVVNGCLEQMNDMSCHQWLSINGCHDDTPASDYSSSDDEADNDD